MQRQEGCLDVMPLRIVLSIPIQRTGTVKVTDKLVKSSLGSKLTVHNEHGTAGQQQRLLQRALLQRDSRLQCGSLGHQRVREL